MKNFGMKYTFLTFDLQLYIVACLIKWSDQERWSHVILRPVMMHTLMSFLGCIGALMKGSGIDTLGGAAFAGLAGIFNGKSWPMALRAFHTVVAALQHGFLKDGPKTDEDMAVYLEGARQHPTGQLWVDCFITPTMITIVSYGHNMKVTTCSSGSASTDEEVLLRSRSSPLHQVDHMAPPRDEQPSR